MTADIKVSRNRIYASLLNATHGELSAFTPVIREACLQEPEFVARLIAWNSMRGRLRDAKSAMPVVTLSVPGFTYGENSLAHLARLDPRNLCKALAFARELKTPGHGHAIGRMVAAYLRAREENWEWFERSFVQHRASITRLYSLFHVKPSRPELENIVFRGGSRKQVRAREAYPLGSAVEAVEMVASLSPGGAAHAVAQHQLPFLVATGALKGNLKTEEVKPEVLRAMTPKEVATNVKALRNLGVQEDAVLRALFEEKLEAYSAGPMDFKASRAAEALSESGDEQMANKLKASQARQLTTLAGLEGSVLVLGDRSPSMKACIEGAVIVAAGVTQAVKGSVWLILFDEGVRFYNATGKSYDELMAQVRGISTGSSTSIGVGLEYALERGFEASVIAVVSDAQENTAPWFAAVYERYCTKFGKLPPVYLFRFPTAMHSYSDIDLADSMSRAGFALDEFPIENADYTMLPNCITSMRADRYSLMDEIYATPLLTIEEALAASLQSFLRR